jgi:threonylcarbamoyladenosine tRNA methylthiotransferase MtaB
LDPFEITKELVDLVSKNSRICPHFHIALQSANDEILKRMRRLYRARDFEDAVTDVK